MLAKFYLQVTANTTGASNDSRLFNMCGWLGESSHGSKFTEFSFKQASKKWQDDSTYTCRTEPGFTTWIHKHKRTRIQTPQTSEEIQSRTVSIQSTNFSRSPDKGTP